MSTESTETPAKRIADGYAVEGQALELGTVVVDGAANPSAQIHIPLTTISLGHDSVDVAPYRKESVECHIH